MGKHFHLIGHFSKNAQLSENACTQINISEAPASGGTINSEAERTCVLNMQERSRISDDEYGQKKE